MCFFRNKIASCFDKLGYYPKTGYVIGSTIGAIGAVTFLLADAVFLTKVLEPMSKNDQDVTPAIISFIILSVFATAFTCISSAFSFYCCANLCAKTPSIVEHKPRKLYELLEQTDNKILLSEVAPEVKPTASLPLLGRAYSV